ncbi:MAG: MarR family winged helix-turn-helix transcriptional regulator [Erythrobacter sp.]|nr:MarR family winged helix-turn-helix transcriptional regulator [Erythrobacter sp.]
MVSNYRNTFADRHFLGRLSEELSDLIAQQSRELMVDRGIVIPPKSCSLMVAIDRHQPASARMLADALGRSHQLMSQKLPKLVGLDLVETIADPNDGRAKLYRLTAHGEAQIASFRHLQPHLERIYIELFEEVGDLSAILRAAVDALEKRPLRDRASAAVC